MPRVFLVSCRHSCGAHNGKVYVAFILFTPFEKPIFREVNFKEENFLEHQFCEKVVFLEDDKKFRAMHKTIQFLDILQVISSKLNLFT